MRFPAIKDIRGWAAFMSTANLSAFSHEDVVRTYRLLHAARRTREAEFLGAYIRRISFAIACNVSYGKQVAEDVCQEIFVALHDPRDHAYEQIADDFAGVVKKRVWAVYARLKRWDSRNKGGPEDFDPPDEKRLNDPDTRAIVEIVYATASPKAIALLNKTTAEVANEEGVSSRHAFRRRKNAEEEIREIALAAQNLMKRDFSETLIPNAEPIADFDDDNLSILDYVLLAFSYDSPKPLQADVARWSTAIPMFAQAIAERAEILTNPFGADGRFAPSKENEKMLAVLWRSALRQVT